MRNYNETKLCISFAKHCETYFPRTPGILNWTHIPLEGRSAQDGAKLKAMGVKSGFFDYIFFWMERNVQQTCFLEAKWGDGDYSLSQKTFMSFMLPMGIPCEKFYSVEEGHNKLLAFGIKPIRQCQYFVEPNTMTWEDKVNSIHDMYKP